MKLGKLIISLGIAASVASISSLNTQANASNWHKGVPKSIAGSWIQKTHDNVTEDNEIWGYYSRKILELHKSNINMTWFYYGKNKTFKTDGSYSSSGENPEYKVIGKNTYKLKNVAGDFGTYKKLGSKLIDKGDHNKVFVRYPGIEDKVKNLNSYTK